MAQKPKLTRNYPSLKPKAWPSCSGQLGPDLRREQCVACSWLAGMGCVTKEPNVLVAAANTGEGRAGHCIGWEGEARRKAATSARGAFRASQMTEQMTVTTFSFALRMNCVCLPTSGRRNTTAVLRDTVRSRVGRRPSDGSCAGSFAGMLQAGTVAPPKI